MRKKNIPHNKYLICLIAFFSIVSICKAQYPQVKIGQQTWMTVNLDTSQFNDGTVILNATTDSMWRDANIKHIPAWCYYKNDAANANMGKLYNWWAVNDTRGLAPKGWHVADKNDWSQLFTYTRVKIGVTLKNWQMLASLLRSKTGWLNWQGKSGNGIDTFGLNIRPNGFRNQGGPFMGFYNTMPQDLLGAGSIFWASDSNPPPSINSAFASVVDYTGRAIVGGGAEKGCGFPVRCISNTVGSFAMNSTGTIASLQITDPQEWNYINNKSLSDPVLKKICTDKIFTTFKDSFDFIIFVINSRTGTQQFYRTICLDEQNTGKSTFNNRTAYGAAQNGKLKGYLYLNQLDHIFYGASLHELCHHWGNGLLETWAVLDTLGCANDTTRTAAEKACPCSNIQFPCGKDITSNACQNDFGHWGFSSVDGQLGGFNSQNTSYDSVSRLCTIRGSFAYNTAGGNKKRYANLELYLMGLADSTEVAPISVYSNIRDYKRIGYDTTYLNLKIYPNGFKQYDNMTRSPIRTFKADKTDYTYAQMKQIAGGVRLPYYKSGAQTNFNVLTVVLTQNPLTDAEWKKVTTQINWLTYKGSDESFANQITYGYNNPTPAGEQLLKEVFNFYEATQGRGTLKAAARAWLK